jgi:hypothetical protein
MSAIERGSMVGFHSILRNGFFAPSSLPAECVVYTLSLKLRSLENLRDRSAPWRVTPSYLGHMYIIIASSLQSGLVAIALVPAAVAHTFPPRAASLSGPHPATTPLVPAALLYPQIVSLIL